MFCNRRSPLLDKVAPQYSFGAEAGFLGLAGLGTECTRDIVLSGREVGLHASRTMCMKWRTTMLGMSLRRRVSSIS